jgi:rRNA processing protein Krr1/Pno1
MTERLNELERQVLIYRERISYHESIEEELKKNIESQVDVVLKMEEERLMMLKENKEFRERNRHLVNENDDFKEKISIFEKELEEL